MSAANKHTVRKFIAAMNNGDATTMGTCLAPGAIAVTRGFSKFTGNANRETILSLTGGLKAIMPDGLGIEILRLIAEGDEVVAEFVSNAVTAAGTTYANQYCMIFTLENGKIVRTHEYFCTRYAEDVLWPVVVEGGLAQQAGGG